MYTLFHRPLPLLARWTLRYIFAMGAACLLGSMALAGVPTTGGGGCPNMDGYSVMLGGPHRFSLGYEKVLNCFSPNGAPLSPLLTADFGLGAASIGAGLTHKTPNNPGIRRDLSSLNYGAVLAFVRTLTNPWVAIENHNYYAFELRFSYAPFGLRLGHYQSDTGGDNVNILSIGLTF